MDTKIALEELIQRYGSEPKVAEALGYKATTKLTKEGNIASGTIDKKIMKFHAEVIPGSVSDSIQSENTGVAEQESVSAKTKSSEEKKKASKKKVKPESSGEKSSKKQSESPESSSKEEKSKEPSERTLLKKTFNQLNERVAQLQKQKKSLVKTEAKLGTKLKNKKFERAYAKIIQRVDKIENSVNGVLNEFKNITKLLSPVDIVKEIVES